MFDSAFSFLYIDGKEGVSVKKIILCLICILVVAMGAVGFYLSSDYYAYQKAAVLMQNEDYEEAIVIFEEISEYKDSQEQIYEAKYQIANQYFKKADYLEAAELFSELKDYKNSYNFLNTSYYNLGHDHYLKKKYDEARTYFDLMDESLKIGVPHFMTYEEGRDYIVEQALEGTTDIRLYMTSFGPLSDGYGLWSKFVYLTMSETATVECDEKEGYVRIQPMYYPGARIVIAHNQDKTDYLTSKEVQTYEKALEIVGQAKQETASELELEVWLNDWICENVEYVMTYDENLDDRRFPNDWTAYGAIIEGEANCQGYADTFYLLASLAGFNVRYQFGEGNDGGHVWNAIELDGKWYYNDTTWNDTGYDPYKKTYAYFNYVEGSADNQTPHQFAKVVETADVVDAEYDYYEAYDCAFDTLKDAARYVVSQKLNKKQNEVHVKVKKAGLDNDDLVASVKSLLNGYGYSFDIVCYDLAETTCYVVYWRSLYH